MSYIVYLVMPPQCLCHMRRRIHVIYSVPGYATAHGSACPYGRAGAQQGQTRTLDLV
jgi:hypothetical protein